MSPQVVSAVLLFAGAVCFFVGSALNLWIVRKGGGS